MKGSLIGLRSGWECVKSKVDLTIPSSLDVSGTVDITTSSMQSLISLPPVGLYLAWSRDHLHQHNELVRPLRTRDLERIHQWHAANFQTVGVRWIVLSNIVRHTVMHIRVWPIANGMCPSSCDVRHPRLKTPWNGGVVPLQWILHLPQKEVDLALLSQCFRPGFQTP